MAKDLKALILKTGRTDREVLQEQADRYAGGNMSAWLRHAGKNYKPRPGEKIDLLPSYVKRRTA